MSATLRAALCSACAFLCASCSTYQLKGKVVEGEISYIAVVEADDPRLTGPGIHATRIELWNDPTRLNRELIGEVMSDQSGSFSIPVEEIGAGFLMYDVGVKTDRPEYVPAELNFRLPPKEQRILIMLEPIVRRR